MNPPQSAYPTNQVQSVQGPTSLNTTQVMSCVLSSSPSASLPPNQQQQMILPSDATSMPQYVYVTADGQVLGAVQPQVDAIISFAFAGNNCVVPYATGSAAGIELGGQPQFLAVNLYTPCQQQVLYVMAQFDQQGGIQYVALQGGNIGIGSGIGVWPMQWQQPQPQYAMVSDQSQKQKIVQVMTNDSGRQSLIQLPSNQILVQTGEQQLMVAATQPQANQVLLGQGQMGQLVLAATQPQGGQVVLGQAGMMVAATPQSAEIYQQVPGQSIQHQLNNHTILNQGASDQVIVAPSAEQPLDVGQQNLQADDEDSGSSAIAQSQNPPEHDISTTNGETADLTRQGVQEDGVQVRFVIDVSGCIIFFGESGWVHENFGNEVL